MEFLPINIRISDARILIVGGGRVATHKASILSRYTERVTVVAPEVSDAVNLSKSPLKAMMLSFFCSAIVVILRG